MQRPQRIKVWMGWLLIITALCVDLTESGIAWLDVVAIGSILNFLLSIFATFIFYVWFHVLGVSMSSNTKRFFTSMITVIIEYLPGIDIVPLLSWAWTVGMILTIIMTRMEDDGEEPSIVGALKKIMSFGSVATPATFAATMVHKQIRRFLPRQNKNVDKQEENTDERTKEIGRKNA